MDFPGRAEFLVSRGGVVFEQLRCAVAQVRCLVAEFEPDRFDGPGARTLVELFDEIERLGAAGKALATRQVVATGAWKHDGAHRDAASWLAGTTGATVGAARATVDTAARLAELPSTEAAWRDGALSLAQVDAIADAATADPTAEAELLERAQHDGVRGLRTACAPGEGRRVHRRRRSYERIRAARSLRTGPTPTAPAASTSAVPSTPPPGSWPRSSPTNVPCSRRRAATAASRMLRCARVRCPGRARRFARFHDRDVTRRHHGRARRLRRVGAGRTLPVRCARSSVAVRSPSRSRSACSTIRS